MKYDVETKNRYRSETVADSYKEGYTKGCSLRILKNKFIAYCEKRAIMKATTYCHDVVKLIDIPCGTGKMTSLLSDKYDVYIGMDMSYEMMQQIKDKEKLTFVQADGTAFPFIDNAVDLIVTLRLIHRLPADIKHKFFTELARVSKNYIIFSFSDNSLLLRILLRIKIALGMVPEKIVVESLDHYHNILVTNGFYFKKKIYVFPFVSNQMIYLYTVNR